ncbi:hypothetical protein BLNAU_5758 [Blattamonas nauphoetae]|uniref:Uncharacterized protein n=1 Tax=Blattamonas nauphoetae TaxID=2049346 RepID=A0ABQ9Y636_9EUKA|nr:hypothetical protein BLNAU_5758 [Blattamonas nauphoetae]
MLHLSLIFILFCEEASPHSRGYEFHQNEQTTKDVNHMAFENRQKEKSLHNASPKPVDSTQDTPALSERFFTSGSAKTRTTPAKTEEKPKYEFKTTWIPSTRFSAPKEVFDKQPKKAEPAVPHQQDPVFKPIEFNPQQAFNKH